MRNFNFIKLLCVACAFFFLAAPAKAEGEYAWPENYGGVMLQGFSWDSYDETAWTNLQNQAGELSDYFDLIWVPNSAKPGSSPSMGYNPVYWFSPNHNSSFGTEAELRDMIATFKNFGTGMIEDVVINHRSGVANWYDFPKETYNGKTYQLGPWAMCKNDGDVTFNNNGLFSDSELGANDTGDGFAGFIDLDHTNAEVQENVKAYLDFLKNDLGYVGWRYDLVKGYAPQYTKLYNESAKAQFSVGEYWDGYDQITRWIDNTGKQSAAFDFPAKYALNDATADYSKLAWLNQETGKYQPAGIIHMPKYRRYAVTFVDNHDTYRESGKYTGNVTVANAFILLSPGTPCVFLQHWLSDKANIKKLIAIRKSAGINNQSEVEVLAQSKNSYVAKIKGSNGDVVLRLGTDSSYLPDGYTNSDRVMNHRFYSVWTKVAIQTLDTKRTDVSFSVPTGYYEGGVDVTITASDSNAKIIYTTDGSTPGINNGTKADSGVKVSIKDRKVTVKAVAAIGDEVVSIIRSATYTTKRVPVTIYLQKPSEWNTVNFYAWSDEFDAKDLLGEWPGRNMAESTVEEKGYTWYKYTTPAECDIVNIIFNNVDAAAKTEDQTSDITGLEGVNYFVLKTFSGKACQVEDVTKQFSGVESIASDDTNVSVYPNPAVSVVNVAAAQDVASIEIYSTSGALVAKSVNAAQVNVSGLQQGFYLYRVTLADGTATQGKLLKK